MARSLRLLFLASLLSGCITLGRDFPSAPVRNITTNTTTQREIFASFGEPDKRGLENGYETWTYSYAYYELGQLREFKELYVAFENDNTVRSYSFNSK